MRLSSLVRLFFCVRAYDVCTCRVPTSYIHASMGEEPLLLLPSSFWPSFLCHLTIQASPSGRAMPPRSPSGGGGGGGGQQRSGKASAQSKQPPFCNPPPPLERPAPPTPRDLSSGYVSGVWCSRRWCVCVCVHSAA